MNTNSVGHRVEIVQPPKPIWKWAPFGDYYALTVHLTQDVSWLARLACRIILGSKWERE